MPFAGDLHIRYAIKIARTLPEEGREMEYFIFPRPLQGGFATGESIHINNICEISPLG
jgi:hypothetical protein